MGKTKKFDKRWLDDERYEDKRRDHLHTKKQKRIKNALRSNNVQDLIDQDEEY